MTRETARIELLDRDRCLQLLREDEIGRLAVLADGGPVILPVNYRMDGESIVFRTDPGLKLDQGVRLTPASRSTTSTGPTARGGASWPPDASRRSPTTRPRRGRASTTCPWSRGPAAPRTTGSG